MRKAQGLVKRVFRLTSDHAPRNEADGGGAKSAPRAPAGPAEHGGHNIETLRVIDWATRTNNEFFLASQMWVAGDMYRRRCDLLGFVNGLPLVFIELKKPAVPQTRPTHTPTSPTARLPGAPRPNGILPGPRSPLFGKPPNTAAR